MSWRTSAPFLACHLVPFAALWTGVTTRSVALFVVLYLGRMFCITAGYHRYFAHRAYRVGRWTQFVLAAGGSAAVQRGPLWWAAHHRAHHRYADTDRDPHTPQKGFWWSHMGWILSGRYGRTEIERVPDLAAYPELVWLDRHDWVAPWVVGVTSFLVAGWSGLVVGFFASTVLLWHVTFMVNSVAHVAGGRRYATPDTSRNNAVVALLTLGEGWHNNHHHYPASARQGFRWWQVDVCWGVLRVLQALRLVHEPRVPSQAALVARPARGDGVDAGLAKVAAVWEHATARRQAVGLASGVTTTE